MFKAVLRSSVRWLSVSIERCFELKNLITGKKSFTAIMKVILETKKSRKPNFRRYFASGICFQKSFGFKAQR